MEDSNIIIKITSEADLTQAQKQMANLTKQADKLEEQIKQTIKAEKEDAKSIKALNLAQKEEAKRLAENARYWKQEREYLRNDIKERKQSIKSLQDQVKSYKTLNGMSGKAVTQLRAMREELMRMEDAGEFGTKAFMELSIRAGELEDRIGDVQQRIRVLSSDTKNLDALSGIGEAVAGGFYVATSAAEVFGDEMEGLQTAFYKVQAAMSIVNGVQSLYNALNKDSAAMIVLNNLVLKLFNREKQKSVELNTLDNATTKRSITLRGIWAVVTAGVTGVTKLLTGAVKALGRAIKANPIGMLIGGLTMAAGAVAGLVKGFMSLFHRESEEQRRLRELREGLKKLQEEYETTEMIVRHAYESTSKWRDVKEKEELRAAKMRKASELEIAKIQEKNAKARAEDVKNYERLIENIEKQKMNITEQIGNSATSEEDRKQLWKDYYELLDREKEFQHNIDMAEQEFYDAQVSVLEAKNEMRKQLFEAKLAMSKESEAKEILQIKHEFKERLDQLQGNSKEEIALRKQLEKQQEYEIAMVRKKYAQQAMETAVQEQKNMLAALAQQRGSEDDYKKELELTRKIAQDEAEIRISALDKNKMSEKEYAAQVEAIRLELAQSLKQIDDEEANRQAENQRRMTDITIQEANNRKNALRGSEGVDEQKAIVKGYYDALKEQLEENARLEREAVERSTDTEEVKAAKIKDIDAKLQADLEANRKESAEAVLAIDEQYLADLEIAVSQAEDRVSRAQGGDRLNALREQRDAQLALYDEQQRELEAKWNAGLITYSEYKQQEWEITKATTDAEVQYQTDAMNAIADGFQTALDYMQQLSDLAFEAINQNIQAELDALDKEYTTDWEEAQKNADKKYITQKEYEKKKAALEEKQAKYAKAQALTNIAIQTAQAIITTLAQLGATPWGIAASVLAGSMGAAQLAVAAAKPLAQYEKGRKGGKGEYAIVGEKGAEIMYIPQGASIIPNNKIDKPAEWAKFGVPELPHSDPEILRYVSEQAGIGLTIDYDRMGESVAKHLPKQRNVTVNVDRSGVSVNDGSQHTYLNAKYNGSWN